MPTAPKDGHTRAENRWTQPMVPRRAFGTTEVLTEGWYPACPSKDLKKGEARSIRLGWQRLAVFRGEDGAVRALDAFCPHMGADLSNGRVEGNALRCYFHGWRFDQDGGCVDTSCGAPPPRSARVQAWPTHEALGHIWVYAGRIAAHPFPSCPGLEGQEVAALRLGSMKLYAHHHAMMIGGIDLQHFKAVHGVDIRFDYTAAHPQPGVMDYHLDGAVPDEGWRGKLGRRLLGERFRYSLRIAGGSIAAISYGVDQKLFGTGRTLPSLNVLWGCRPLEDGVSEVEVFLLAPRRPGAAGRLRQAAQLAVTLGLLGMLDDDDRRAFPHMRFDPRVMVKEDQPVIELMRFLDGLPVSAWSKVRPDEADARRRSVR